MSISGLPHTTAPYSSGWRSIVLATSRPPLLRPSMPMWRGDEMRRAAKRGVTVSTTTLNDDVRQNYPISDMRFSVAQLVSRLSNDMTLEPGDVILCGTSVGVGSMKPGSTVEVEIAGIGTLGNRFG